MPKIRQPNIPKLIWRTITALAGSISFVLLAVPAHLLIIGVGGYEGSFDALLYSLFDTAQVAAIFGAIIGFAFPRVGLFFFDLLLQIVTGFEVD